MINIRKRTSLLLGALSLGLVFALSSANSAQAGFTPASSSKTTLATNASSDIVQGGGENVPLSTALKQILPPQVGFNATQDVDLSTPVSWQGGRPWRDVLHDTLKSVNLIAIEDQGHVLNIQKITLTTLPDNQAGNQGASSTTASGVSQEMGSVSGTWTAERGTTLRTVLQDWCGRAQVDLHWDSSFDYPIMTDISIEGSFEQAVQTLLSGFEKANPRPFGYLHKNSQVGHPVLVVEAHGNNYGE